MKHSLYRKPILLFLLLCLLSSSCVTAFAVTAEDFSDVFSSDTPDNKAYWGYSYIDTAARTGIIQGYLLEDGKRVFLPQNNVTKQEAVTMVVNTLTQASLGYVYKDYTSSWEEVLTAFGIDSWAKPYVAFGLETGFLEKKELSSFMDSSSGLSLPASREEVITWVGRALYSGYGLNEKQIYSLTYTDKEEVSGSAAPYLALLTRIGIIRGNQNADGTYSFAPKRALSRVEFAVICNQVFGLSPKTLTPFGSLSGVLTGITTDSDTGTVTLALGSGSLTVSVDYPLLFDGEVREEGLKSLSVGSLLSLSWSKDGVLRIDTMPARASGVLTQISQENAGGYRELTIRLAGGSLSRYYINPSLPGVRLFGTLTVNHSVQLLADGVNIIELSVQ